MTIGSTPARTPTDTRIATSAFVADVVCILLFVAVGRRNHAEGVTLSGVAHTAWPFLAGLVVGWVLFRAWQQPTTIRPTGVGVWLSTVAIGMGLRVVTGAGIAVSFILVATGVTGLLLLGWRAAVAALTRRKG